MNWPEKDGEEVEDAIEIEVSAEFQAVFSVRETDNVDELRALDRRFARAEIISTELQKPASGLNSRQSRRCLPRPVRDRAQTENETR